MPTHLLKDVKDMTPDEFVSLIRSECGPGGGIKTMTATQYITDQQRAWWKGVLLPSLAKHTGDTINWWETRLKLAVFPDKFHPKHVAVGRDIVDIIPSITILGKRDMIKLIDGAVGHLHDEKQYLRGNIRYGNEFDWVTLPNEELRASWRNKE